MKTASGKNSGTYSIRRIHVSESAASTVGFDGNLSTNVTAIIIPHTTNITRPNQEKKRRNKKGGNTDE